MIGKHLDEVSGFLPLLAGDGAWLEELRDPNSDRRLWWATSELERELLDAEWAGLERLLPTLAEGAPLPAEERAVSELSTALVRTGWFRPAAPGEPDPDDK